MSHGESIVIDNQARVDCRMLMHSDWIGKSTNYSDVGIGRFVAET